MCDKKLQRNSKHPVPLRGVATIGVSRDSLTGPFVCALLQKNQKLEHTLQLEVLLETM